jgi:hypothetical protein
MELTGMGDEEMETTRDSYFKKVAGKGRSELEGAGGEDVGKNVPLTGQAVAAALSMARARTPSDSQLCFPCHRVKDEQGGAPALNQLFFFHNRRFWGKRS